MGYQIVMSAALVAVEAVVVVIPIKRWGIAGTWCRVRDMFKTLAYRLTWGWPPHHDRHELALERIAELERELGLDARDG